MIADQATPFTADNNSMFCPTFKPLDASNGIQSSKNVNPFAQDMSPGFSPASTFTMNSEFQSFNPTATNVPTPFTPVSPISSSQSIGQGSNMSMNANPFTFQRSES